MLQKLKSKQVIKWLLLLGLLLIVLLAVYSTLLANHRKTTTIEKSQSLISSSVPIGYSYKIAPVDCYNSSADYGPGFTYCRVLFSYTPADKSRTSVDAYTSLKNNG